MLVPLCLTLRRRTPTPQIKMHLTYMRSKSTMIVQKATNVLYIKTPRTNLITTNCVRLSLIYCKSKLTEIKNRKPGRYVMIDCTSRQVDKAARRKEMPRIHLHSKLPHITRFRIIKLHFCNRAAFIHAKVQWKMKNKTKTVVNRRKSMTCHLTSTK